MLGLGILLGIIAPRYLRQRGSSWVSLLKAGTIPLLVALLVTAYTNGTWLQYYAEAIRAEGFHRPRRDGGPAAGRALPGAPAAGGQGQGERPDLLCRGEFGDMMPAWVPAGQSEPVVVSQQWMAAPLLMFAFLPDERKQVYMERYTERQGGGGWLIERRQDGAVVDQSISPDPWFFQQVDRTHTPTKIAQNARVAVGLVRAQSQRGSGGAGGGAQRAGAGTAGRSADQRAVAERERAASGVGLFRPGVE